MRTTFSCALVALVAVGNAAAQEVAVAPVPDWALPVPSGEDVPPSGEAVTARAFDLQTRFGEAATEAFLTSHLRIETPEGLQIGNLALGWSAVSATLTVHEVAIERDGAMIDVLEEGGRFRVIDAEPQLGQAMISGMKTASLQVEGLRVGDTLRLAYTISERDPLIGAVAGDFVVRPQMPGGTGRLRFLWDEALDMRWRIVGELGAMAPHLRGPRDVVLTLGEPDYEDLPSGAPPRAALSPRIAFSAYRDWEEVSALFEEAYEEAAVIPAGGPLASEVARIAAESADPRVRADRALDLVQDQVRYLFSALGVGGYAPAPAAEVWEKRFGDCKGKTVLLLALLRELGIEADPALVATTAGDALPELLPTPRAFDHVVVRARIGGQTYWLDGTEQGGAIEDADLSPYRFALPMTESEDVLVRIEGRAREEPDRVVTIAIDGRAGPAGALPVTVDQTLTGPFTQAARLALPLGEEQRKQQLWFLFGDLDADFEWDGIEIDAPPVGPARVTATGTITLEERGEAGDRSYVVPGGELGWSPRDMEEVDSDRHLPWFVGWTGHTAVTTTIDLPPQGPFHLGGLNIDTSAAGLTAFRRTTLSEGGLVMEGRWRSDVTEIPAGEIAEAARLLEKAYENDPTFSRNAAGRKAEWSPQELSRLADQEPNDFAGFLERGRAYHDARRYEEALADYDAALERNPGSLTVRVNRGMILFWLGRGEEAEAELRAVLETDPEDYVALHGLGALHLERGEPEAAILHLSDALAIKPSDAFARRQRALAYLEAGRFDEARADLDDLTRKWPDDPALRLVEVGLLVRTEETEEALRVLDGVLAQAPEARLYAMQADLLAELGQFEEATVAFGEATALDPSNAALWNQSCWFKATHDRALDSALEDCDRALGLRPDVPAFLDSRGLVHFRLGRLEAARADYDAALRKAPAQAASLYGRALVHAAMGLNDAARADLQAARDAAPGIEEEFTQYGLALEL